MNFNKDLFEKTEAIESSDFESLELGGHEIIIKDVREYLSDFSHNVSLKVSVDIDGNDKQKGYFQKQYDSNTNENKKWSNGATKYLSLKDENLGFLKGFITAVEKSNPNFKFNINGDWSQLNGKKLAGQFGLEEYQKEDGNIGTVVKLVQFRSLDKLSEIKIPRVKKIDGSYVKYEDYKNNTNSTNKVDSDFGSAVEIDADFLD